MPMQSAAMEPMIGLDSITVDVAISHDNYYVPWLHFQCKRNRSRPIYRPVVN